MMSFFRNSEENQKCLNLQRLFNRKTKEIEYLLLISRTSISLENPISDDNNATFLDFLESENEQSIDEKIDKEKMEKELNELLDELKPKEAEILRRRFGIGCVDNETLEEIGDSMSLSRERIRQIEEKAKKTIMKMAKSKALRDYLK